MNVEIDSLRHGAIEPWGWEVALYLFLGGLAAGVMVYAALLRRRIPLEEQCCWLRRVPFVAPLLLAIGMSALFIDLRFKAHAFQLYTAFRMTAPMSWGAWILLLVFPSTIALGLAHLSCAELEKSRFSRIHGILKLACKNAKRLETLNLTLGIALGTYGGILLGSLGARMVWSSAIIGPLFLISGLWTASALLLLMPLSEMERTVIRPWAIRIGVVEVLLLTLFFIHLGSAGERGRAAASLFLGGEHTAVFWSIDVIAGLAVPIAMLIVEQRRNLRPAAAVPVLMLIGGFTLRMIFVAAGQL